MSLSNMNVPGQVILSQVMIQRLGCQVLWFLYLQHLAPKAALGGCYPRERMEMFGALIPLAHILLARTPSHSLTQMKRMLGSVVPDQQLLFIIAIPSMKASRKFQWIARASQMVKNQPASAEDVGLIPGSGRSPGVGNHNPLQYSCLGNSMDRGAWWATVHGASKSWARLSTHTQI